MRLTINNRLCFWLIAVAAIFHSCTKTEYTDYEQETANRILEYRVTNATQELLGAINQATNTITVYIPYYLGIDYLVAEITLDEGARLLDSLGNEINQDGGIEPVPLEADSVEYIVESATGITRTYYLVQKILPYPDTLSVRYSVDVEDGATLWKPVYSNLSILGNFESTSMNARFYLTDRETGEVFDDFLSVTSVTAASDDYTMVARILPDAKAGTYDVTMEHQGRTATLPGLTLEYIKPYHGNMSSASAYAPGDTIEFNTLNGVFVGLERIYLKFTKQYLTLYPADFPEELFDTPIEMEILEWNRTHIKAIFPEAPVGNYGANRSWTYNSSRTEYTMNYSGLAFYADFDDQTTFGKGVGFASSLSGFEVKAKQE